MIKKGAHIISIIFHPLFMLTYMVVILLLVNPYLFGAYQLSERSLLIIQIFLTSAFIPLVAVFMMRMLGLVKSIQMEDKYDRIGPYICTGTFYLWLYVNFVNNSSIPQAYNIFLLGATIALFMAFFINNFTKISLHTVGAGGLLGMMVLTKLFFSYDSFNINLEAGKSIQIETSTLLMAVIILVGMIGTARLILNAHNPRQVYLGFVVGFGAQFLALRFLL